MQLHQQKGMISLSPPTICNSADYGARYDRVSCRAPAWHQCKPDIQMAQAILRRFTDGCCIGRGSGAGLRTRCRQ
uniref:Uncharacterized protein n=1 Tax=Salmonella sp. TaxID=599 RepID=A0A6M4NLZ4_SALSP|nr:hypothetical protein [Salmonella sp.]